MGYDFLHIYTTTCVCASLPQLSSACLHTHTQLERLWVCDVNRGQGVSGLALTTGQGGVLAQGSRLTFLVHWHTVCSRASLSHRRAMDTRRLCGKANSKELFFKFWWGPAAWKEFSSLLCWTQGPWQSHYNWHGPLQ